MSWKGYRVKTGNHRVSGVGHSNFTFIVDWLEGIKLEILGN